MRIEIVKQNTKYFIRSVFSYSWRRRSGSWIEYYTTGHSWSKEKSEAVLLDTQDEAENFYEKVVKILN